MKPIANWLVYMLVRIILCIIQAMPIETCYRLADGLGNLLYKLDKRHRKVALENIHFAFPGKYTRRQAEKMVLEVYCHFSRIISEIAHIPRRFSTTTWESYITMEGRSLMARLMIEDRPLVLVTAHYGNWEMAGYIAGMFGFRPYSVARTLDNPYLEDLIRMFRTRTGQRIIYKRGAFDQVSEVMRKKYPVGLLADQHAGHRGAIVDFMGRPASNHRGPAMLALEHDALIVMVFSRRMGHGFQYYVWPEDVIDPRDYKHDPEAVQNITQRCADATAEAIRKAPEQYLWLHRRWRVPASELGKAA